MSQVFALVHLASQYDGLTTSKLNGFFSSRDKAADARRALLAIPGYARRPDGFRVVALQMDEPISQRDSDELLYGGSFI